MRKQQNGPNTLKSLNEDGFEPNKTHYFDNSIPHYTSLNMEKNQKQNKTKEPSNYLISLFKYSSSN